jgi:hypothetical protein
LNCIKYQIEKVERVRALEIKAYLLLALLGQWKNFAIATPIGPSVPPDNAQRTHDDSITKNNMKRLFQWFTKDKIK